MLSAKILRRGFLATAALIAFAMVSLATPSEAEARGCHRSYGGGYGHSSYYNGGHRSYGNSYSHGYGHGYGGYNYYSPRVHHVGYPSHYGGSGVYYRGRGVSVGIGF